ncbi:MAG TPA: prepilin-type cleavage/methylation domain-containing protein [Halieaceae bacterium]|jgi:type IV pilus assembly protein PilE|uniref:type IV pilin protein n=1 Tax=Haliea TaxID=475794 RepID=UPI000422AB0F|nr:MULTISPECIES: type IV pilin protein [Haliea]HBM82201.1 prepilin-type cleavage/methylation domain-containing protein [Halieaceae bacterium]MAD64730.1 prepilin-type cleavage/methylation domain-containing protein [Haliea sp.]MAY92572.1 prepilin-type cleavage/methylation domain-containing protein [Haliea sp.]MBK39570.1 prepilin-type cleavage/methylation domain-containing protein [Haliea sp.]MBP70773.1 prepilin-type cleavage/methylation domain-containing protein [Haliea sp.]|tara:strand:- start:2199 stop:2669 length:471 start_codon:yes stop_codon:yes gene_type:complete
MPGTAVSIAQRRGMAGRSATAGFTLMEVMIVVVIVGILMAIALPAYQGSLQKGRRSDAMSALLDASNRQQQFMLDQGRYTTDMQELGYAASPRISEEGHYSISAAACSGGVIANCFELTATPVSGSPQSSDTRCTTFVLDSFGTRSATGTTATECW